MMNKGGLQGKDSDDEYNRALIFCSALALVYFSTEVQALSVVSSSR
jgi:hypothetical protein